MLCCCKRIPNWGADAAVGHEVLSAEISVLILEQARALVAWSAPKGPALWHCCIDGEASNIRTWGTLKPSYPTCVTGSCLCSSRSPLSLKCIGEDTPARLASDRWPVVVSNTAGNQAIRGRFRGVHCFPCVVSALLWLKIPFGHSDYK